MGRKAPSDLRFLEVDPRMGPDGQLKSGFSWNQRSSSNTNRSPRQIRLKQNVDGMADIIKNLEKSQSFKKNIVINDADSASDDEEPETRKNSSIARSETVEW